MFLYFVYTCAFLDYVMLFLIKLYTHFVFYFLTVINKPARVLSIIVIIEIAKLNEIT